MRYLIVTLASLVMLSVLRVNFVYTAELQGVDVLAQRPLSDDEFTVACLVCSESLDQPYRGKVAVANVVYNRFLNNPNKYDTYSDVVMEKGQFDGIRNKYFKKPPTQDCIQAMKQILRKKQVILPRSVEFFLNPRISTDDDWVNYITRYPHEIISDHGFYYNPKLPQSYRALP